jgi:hypothetical protein
VFTDGDRKGVSVLGQGEIPEDLEHDVIQRVAESTTWNFGGGSRRPRRSVKGNFAPFRCATGSRAF